MPVIAQPKIEIYDRGYEQKYELKYYTKSAKIDLRIYEYNNRRAANLKMSKREAEELITRLQYAILEAEGKL